MLVVKKFVFNPFAENTFVIWDEVTNECMIIDPGCSTTDEERKLKDYIEGNRLRVSLLLNTHGHIDHILGCKFIKDEFNPQFYFPERDVDLLDHSSKQAAAFGIEIKNPPLPDILITDNTELKIGSSPIKFLFTPGHTKGEHCFYFQRESFCITGDVLFRNSIGRTDLYGGDYDELMSSIKTELLTLPDNVLIYPGHGDSSKIGIEKSDNPFLHEVRKKIR